MLSLTEYACFVEQSILHARVGVHYSEHGHEHLPGN
jgi:hypothetical protein